MSTRPPLSLPSLRIPPVGRPQTDRRPADEKASATPRPAPKRSLNEAAHKLGR
jgi:hypothetical protein